MFVSIRNIVFAFAINSCHLAAPDTVDILSYSHVYRLVRLMTMSPLYLCSKPSSTGTHNEEKTDPIFYIHRLNYDGITSLNLESQPQISNLV